MKFPNRLQSALGPHWPHIVILLSPLILFWRLLVTGRVIFWGLPLLQFYPWRWLALQQIRAGQWPLWNPYLGNGAPLLANYQTAVFYPPNWLGFILPLDYSLGFVAVLHIIWAGVGMIAFARSIGLRPLGQTIAGLSFSLSTYLVARMSFLTIIAAAAWLPWLLWAGEHLTQTLAAPAADSGVQRRHGLAWFLALSGLMALQLLAGHAQTTFYSLVLVGLWIVWRGLTFKLRPQRGASQSPISVLSPTVTFVLAFIFAVCLTAIQLLPTVELLRQSSRAESAGYDFIVTYSLWPWRLLTFVAPDTFGNPAHGDYWGYGNYWEDSAYIGLLPLGLAVMAVFAWVRGKLRVRNSELGKSGRHAGVPSPNSQLAIPNSQLALPSSLSHTPFLLTLALLALILAMGQNTPVFPFFYRYVATFNLFQAPARMTISYVLAVALLAGIGADAWAKPEGGWLYWTRLGVAGGLAIVIASGAGAFLLPRPIATPGGVNPALLVFQTFPRAAGIAGVLTMISFGLSLSRPANVGWRWESAVVAFVAADLIVAGHSLTPTIEADLYRRPTSIGAPLRDFLAGGRLFQSADDEYRAKYKRFFRFDSLGVKNLDEWMQAREAQVPNVASMEGIASANNFDPLIPARQSKLLDALEASTPPQTWTLLEMMGVRAVVSADRIAGLTRWGGGDEFAIYAMPRQPARIRILYLIQAADGPQQALEFVTAPGFDPESTAVIESSELAFRSRPRSIVCRSGLFDRFSRRYNDANIGAVIVSVETVCQYYLDSAYGALTRPATALAALPQAGAFAIASPGREDMLGPFEALGSPPPGQPILLTESSTHITIAAPMEFSGYVVLADTYYPGWRAYLDGQPAPLVPADFAFRGVFVPIGQHMVEFRYEPASFRFGAILSAAAFLIFSSLSLWVLWKRDR
ncbi:MAG: hypothetical protein HY023_17215 [Chloroflexi bacterium]|nr:hypothetical protein [Chloroflexota bacterium]